MYRPVDELQNKFLMAMCKMLYPANYGVKYNMWRKRSFLRAMKAMDDGVEYD
jgi:hypothetical protein